jgi:hypothetical protein
MREPETGKGIGFVLGFRARGLPTPVTLCHRDDSSAEVEAGPLRRGLAEFPKTHPLVGAIRNESEDRGGQSITIVELKE